VDKRVSAGTLRHNTYYRWKLARMLVAVAALESGRFDDEGG